MTPRIAVRNGLSCTDMLKYRLRYVLSWIMISVVLSFLGTSCQQDEDIIALYINSDQVHTQCIWDKAPHCAFTDLTVYNDKLYCCFREGTAHVPTTKNEFGGIRVLSSADGGTNWHDCGLITQPDYDLRDPKLTVTPDNRLMLMFGRYLPTPPENPYPWTQVKFISDEEIENSAFNNENLLDVNIENNENLSNYWLWHTEWIDNESWGIAYKGDNLPLLVKSTDGVNYSLASILQAPGNEADIEKLDNGDMLIVMRAANSTASAYIGLASAPYTNWHWIEHETWLHSPVITEAEGETFVACRAPYGTTLYQYKDSRLTPIMALENSYDNAYPGLAYLNGNLGISYYSTQTGNAAIYFAKIAIDELIQK